MLSRRIWSLAVGTMGAIAAFGLSMTMAAKGLQHLAGSEWRPVEISDKSVPVNAPLFIRFGADGRATGHGGCNSMMGSFTIDKATLRIGPLMSTRKACPSGIMTLEHAFSKALGETRLFLRNGTKLTLKNNQGVTTLRFVQSDWD